jgi:hypothetical protein
MQHDACATGPYRVTDGDRTAIDIQAILIDRCKG